MEKIKNFFIKNGFISVIAIFITVFAYFFGLNWIGTFTLGFFFGRNWEIIKKLWKESDLKTKIDDFSDDVKEKF